MKTSFLSLADQAPPGFEFKTPSKRELLGGRLALHLDRIEDALELLPDLPERGQGILVTEDESFGYRSLGPMLWHVTVPPGLRQVLRPMAELLLDVLSAGSDAVEESYGLRVSLRRQERLHTETRKIYNQTVHRLHQSLDQLSRENEKRRRVEDALRKSREDLRSTLDSIGDGVISADEEGVVLGMNSVAERLTGWTDEEATGRPFDQVFRIVDRGPSNFQVDPGQSGFDPAKGVGGGGSVLLSRTGEEFRITRSFGSLRHEDGSPLGMVAVFRDETESFRREQQLVQAQKMEAVGTLAGGLAHDLNNVLAGIVGPVSLVEFCLAGDGELSREELEGYVSMIRSSSKRAADLVSQLLAISHGHRLSFARADLHHCLESVLRIARTTFDKSVTIRYTQNPDPCWAWADPAQVEQIVLNLLINACHAMTLMRSEGDRWGGEIRVTVDSVQVGEGVEEQDEIVRPGRYWRIRVEDEGVGIGEEDLPQVFTPFFTTKGKGKGTGLGLAMVYNIVQKHLGFVKIDSRVGEGTDFRVHIPVLEIEPGSPDGSPPEEVEAPAPAPVGSSQETILLVDDESSLLETARGMLEKRGYRILVAQGGPEGLELFLERRAEIDLVLLDIVMPVMPGDEVFRAIQEAAPGTRVLLTSGFSQDERIGRILEQGARGFLRKPYDIDGLSRAVAQVLSEPSK